MARAGFARLAGTGVSAAATGLTTALPILLLQVGGGPGLVGAYTLAISPAIIGVAVQRSVLSQTVLRGRSFRGVPNLVGSLLIIYMICTSVALALSYIIAERIPLQILAAATPLILLQDAYRYRCFGQLKAWRAAAADIIWLTSLLGYAAWAWQDPALRTGAGIVGYSLGVTLSVSFALATWPRGEGVEIRAPRVRHLLFEATIICLFGQLGGYAAAFGVSLDALGTLSLAQTAMAPASFTVGFLTSFVIPRLAMRRRDTLKKAFLVLICTAGAGATGMAALLGLTEVTGWNIIPLNRSFFLTTAIWGLGVAVGGFNAILFSHLRQSRAHRDWLRARLLGTASDPVVSVPLGFVLGAPGVACGALVANLTMLGLVASSSKTTSFSLRKVMSQTHSHVVGTALERSKPTTKQ